MDDVQHENSAPPITLSSDDAAIEVMTPPLSRLQSNRLPLLPPPPPPQQQQQHESPRLRHKSLLPLNANAASVLSPAAAPTTTYYATDDDMVYEAIEQVRRWKERPNQTRITGYLRKRHKVDQATTERLLDDMVRRKRICRVWYMDDVTYRSLEQHRRCPRGSPMASSTSPGGGGGGGGGQDNYDSNCDNDDDEDELDSESDAEKEVDRNHRSSATFSDPIDVPWRPPKEEIKQQQGRRRRSLKKKQQQQRFELKNAIERFGTDDASTPPMPPPVPPRSAATHFDMNEEDLLLQPHNAHVNEQQHVKGNTGQYLDDNMCSDGADYYRPRAKQTRDQGVQSGDMNSGKEIISKKVNSGSSCCSSLAHAGGAAANSQIRQTLQQQIASSCNENNPRGKLRPLGPKPPPQSDQQQQQTVSPCLVKNQKLKRLQPQQQQVVGSEAEKKNGASASAPRMKRKYCRRRLIPSSPVVTSSSAQQQQLSTLRAAGKKPSLNLNSSSSFQHTQNAASSSSYAALTTPTKTMKNKKNKMKKKGRKRAAALLLSKQQKFLSVPQKRLLFDGSEITGKTRKYLRRSIGAALGDDEGRFLDDSTRRRPSLREDEHAHDDAEIFQAEKITAAAKFPTKFGVLNQLRKSYANYNNNNNNNNETTSNLRTLYSPLFSVSELDQHARFLSAYERRVAGFLASRRKAAAERSYNIVFGSSSSFLLLPSSNSAAAASNRPPPTFGCIGIAQMLGSRSDLLFYNTSQKRDEKSNATQKTNEPSAPDGCTNAALLQQHSM